MVLRLIALSTLILALMTDNAGSSRAETVRPLPFDDISWGDRQTTVRERLEQSGWVASPQNEGDYKATSECLSMERQILGGNCLAKFYWFSPDSKAIWKASLFWFATAETSDQREREMAVRFDELDRLLTKRYGWNDKVETSLMMKHGAPNDGIRDIRWIDCSVGDLCMSYDSSFLVVEYTSEQWHTWERIKNRKAEQKAPAHERR